VKLGRDDNAFITAASFAERAQANSVIASVDWREKA
jgi:hypothetical protein